MSEYIKSYKNKKINLNTKEDKLRIRGKKIYIRGKINLYTKEDKLRIRGKINLNTYINKNTVKVSCKCYTKNPQLPPQR